MRASLTILGADGYRGNDGMELDARRGFIYGKWVSGNRVA